MSRGRRSASVLLRQLPEYQAGYQAGYHAGREAGYNSYGERFAGTSIIIPTFNKVRYLKRCIDSIRKYTAEPYEIIVVDNGSTDGTAQYIRNETEIRYKRFDSNRGFAAAVNYGMMMAKGSSILLLNNDTVVTPRWLTNMLICLYSEPSVGAVGPVTNNISGRQRIYPRYRTLLQMQSFAERFNCSNPVLWEPVNRLTGFCLLFRRDVFERVGYFDEGYRIGNYEDDDFGLRIRICGLKLIIARDSFIHHYRSVSIRSIGRSFRRIHKQNALYYRKKWGDPAALAGEIQSKLGPDPAGAVDFYPDRAVVRGPGEQQYWIQGGIRRPVVGNTPVPAVRVSQIDLQGWEVGEPIPAEEICPGPALAGEEGQIYRLPNGTYYQLSNGKLRRFVSEIAVERWNIDPASAAPLTDEVRERYEEGLPIIPPPLLIDNNNIL
jgi:GT2 family glycosyltransferase